MPITRVRSDVQAVVYDSTIGQNIALNPGDEYDDGDAIVKQFPWAFQTDAKAAPKVRQREARIEQATAAPGERR